jgi:hypothetical protein
MTRFHRILSLIGLMLFAAVESHAQTDAQTDASVTGILLNRDAEPVPSVYIVVRNREKIVASAISSEEGAFSIDLKDGEYTITGYYFDSILFERSVSVGEPVDLGVITVSPALALDDVVVSGRKPLIRQTEDKLVFQVQNLPDLTRYSANDLLKYVPRVTAGIDGSLSVADRPATLFVNDRRLSAEEAALFIQSMNAKEIKQIEVQTTRSGEQAADISGGVIHIRTMPVRMGLSGNVRLYASSPKAHYYHLFPGVNLFYGKKTWNLYGSYHLSRARAFQYSETTNDYSTQDDRHVQTSRYVSHQNQNSYKIGGVIAFGKNHTAALEFNGNVDSPKDNAGNGNMWVYHQDHLVSTGVSSTTYGLRADFTNVAASYTWKMDSLGSTLKLLGNYNHKNTASSNGFLAKYDRLTGNDLNQTSRNDVAACNFSLKGDLRKNWSNKWSLRSGFHALESRRTSDLRVEDHIPETASTSTRWHLTETIWAGYLGVSKTFASKLFLYLNLMVENTAIAGESRDSDEKIRRRYVDFFPYFYLSSSKRKFSWSLSYVRTIYRPPFYLMNNYSNRVSDVLYDIGNPLLRPHTPHLVELSAKYGSHSTKLSYRVIPNMISEYFYVEDGITYHTNANRGTAKTLGADYSFNRKVFGWWMTNVYAYIGHTEMPDSYNRKAITHGMVTLNNSLSFNKIGEIQLAVNYISNTIWGNSFNRGQTRVDLSYGRSFLKNALGLSVGVNDIFNRSRVSTQIRVPGLDYTFYARALPRSVWLRIGYNFSTKRQVGKNQLQNENKITDRL